ncbi:hypothetical protein FQA39_LY02405 [Lamprigera yunnana]|nr:hypothetical protein FQA39_LY02405 [Lamprigera yunnana]
MLIREVRNSILYSNPNLKNVLSNFNRKHDYFRCNFSINYIKDIRHVKDKMKINGTVFKALYDSIISVPRTLKNQSAGILRLWVRQCEFVFAQRVRRGQQMISLYTKLWEERALVELLSKMRRQISKCGKEVIISAVGISAYNWDSNRISNNDMKKYLNELDYIYLLAEKTIGCEHCSELQKDVCKCDNNNGNEKRSYDNWIPFVEKQDMVVWRKEHENSNYYEYKVYGSFNDVSGEDFLNVHIDTKYRKLWDNTAISLEVIEQDPSPNSHSDIVYWEMLWPKLFVNRDYVFNRRFMVDSDKKAIILMSRGTKHPACPVKENKYRVDTYWSCMIIKPYTELDKPGIEFGLTYFDNPGVNIPSTVTTWVAMRAMPDYLNRLRLATREYKSYCQSNSVNYICRISDYQSKVEDDETVTQVLLHKQKSRTQSALMLSIENIIRSRIRRSQGIYITDEDKLSKDAATNSLNSPADNMSERSKKNVEMVLNHGNTNKNIGLGCLTMNDDKTIQSLQSDYFNNDENIDINNCEMILLGDDVPDGFVTNTPGNSNIENIPTKDNYLTFDSNLLQDEKSCESSSLQENASNNNNYHENDTVHGETDINYLLNDFFGMWPVDYQFDIHFLKKFMKFKYTIPKSIDCSRNADFPYHQVIIIGAGISGIAASLTLYQSGYRNIKILEAQEEPGGRIKTLQLENGFIELGAQWIHGTTNNCLYKIAKKHGLLSTELSKEGTGLFVRDDGLIFDNQLINDVHVQIERISLECEKFVHKHTFPYSFGDFLEEQFHNYLEQSNLPDEVCEMKKELFDWHVRFLLVDNSCNCLKKVSAKEWGKYIDGSEYVNLRNGYKSLVDTLLKMIPSEIVQCKCPVVKIDWNNHRNIMKIHCANGKTFYCDHIIVTTSLGVLKSSECIFEPPLPQSLKQSIDAIGFYGIAKIFLIFEHKWWNTNGFQLVWRKSTKLSGANSWTRFITGFDVIYNQPNILLGWVGGEGVPKMEKLTDVEVGNHCTDLLKQFLNQSVPKPIKVIRSKWMSSPWVLGSYSHITTRCDKTDTGPNTLRKPVVVRGVPKILLAGEACSPTHFSTTHGAFESGQKQANTLIKYFRRTKTQSSYFDI